MTKPQAASDSTPFWNQTLRAQDIDAEVPSLPQEPSTLAPSFMTEDLISRLASPPPLCSSVLGIILAVVNPSLLLVLMVVDSVSEAVPDLAIDLIGLLLGCFMVMRF